MGERLINMALVHKNEWNEPVSECIAHSVSVIIPVFYPEHLEAVLKHLRYIGGYDEIILVDDTGDLDIDSYANIIKNPDIKVFFHTNNLGRSAARNTGASKARGDILVFIDQDMFLASSFFSTMQTYYASNDSLIFLGARQNDLYEDIPTSSEWICPKKESDWRYRTLVEDGFIDLTVLGVGGKNNGCKSGNPISIFEKTNSLKNMGISKHTTIGFWDLPCMVISHSMAIKKRDFDRIGGFPEWIEGWGGEDIVVGFLACAANIPIVLSECVSYQAVHRPYSGSEEAKITELANNIKKYRRWAKKVYEFPIINIDKIKERSISIEKMSEENG